MSRLHFPRRQLLVAATAAAVMPRVAVAAETKLRFRLDWTPQGYHCIWALADERSMFAAEGLSVQQDAGGGSGDSIVKVAAGAYDVALADVNGLVAFNAANPRRRVIAVCMIYNRSPAAIVTLARSGIKTGRELAGRTIGSPDGEASRALFPVYAAAIGLDPASVRWVSMTAALRETMLATGQVDAIAGFQMSSVTNLRAMGVKPADIVAFSFAEAGADLYGSAVVAEADWAARNPEPLRGFVRATIAGLRAAVREPEVAIAALKQRNPLINASVETEKWALTQQIAVITDDVRQNGIGTMTPARMARVVEVNARINGLANPPAPELIYSADYLPPLEERLL